MRIEIYFKEIQSIIDSFHAIEILYAIILVIAIVFLYGVWVFLKSMNHVFSDAVNLFNYASNMKGITKFNKYIAQIGPNKDFIDLFQDDSHTTGYNLFLNIIRFFPKAHILRCTQTFNLFVFILFLATCYLIMIRVADPLIKSPDAGIAVLFTGLIAIRSKLLYVVFLPFSEIINYFIFALVALVIVETSTKIDFIFGIIFGSLAGLSFRNRKTDFVLFVSLLLYFFTKHIQGYVYLSFISAFIIVNLDILYINIFMRQQSDNALNIMQLNSVHSFSLLNFIKFSISNLLKSVNFLRRDSFRSSVGSSFMLLMFSLFICWQKKNFSNIELFFLIYSVILILTVSLIRKNLIGQKNNESFFGSRQLYIIFIISIFFNYNAFHYILRTNQITEYQLIYIIWIICYILFNIYKIISHHYLDQIKETELPIYYKKVEPFRKELNTFMQNVHKPIVLLGYYLTWGEIFNFFNFSYLVKAVNVFRKITDEEIIYFIELLKITHIVVTPMSAFIGSQCSLGKDHLSPSLRDILSPLPGYNEIIIYQVNKLDKLV